MTFCFRLPLLMAQVAQLLGIGSISMRNVCLSVIFIDYLSTPGSLAFMAPGQPRQSTE